MKKVSIYLADKTVEILDKMAQFSPFDKYQEWQAYGIIIDEMLLELQKISVCPIIPGFNLVQRYPI